MSSISKALRTQRPDLVPASKFVLDLHNDPYLKAEMRDKQRVASGKPKKKLPDWYTPDKVVPKAAASKQKKLPKVDLKPGANTGLMLAIMVIALMGGTLGGVFLHQGRVNARMQTVQAAPPAVVDYAEAVMEEVATPTPPAEVLAEFKAPATEVAATDTVEQMAPPAMVAEAAPAEAPVTLTPVQPAETVTLAMAVKQPAPSQAVMLQPQVLQPPARTMPVPQIAASANTVPQVPTGVIHEVLYEGEVVPTETAAPVPVAAAAVPVTDTAPVKSTPKDVEIRVEGIFWDSTRPMAIVNGEIYEVGDEVESGHKIAEIQRSAVIISNNGKLRTHRP